MVNQPVAPETGPSTYITHIQPLQHHEYRRRQLEEAKPGKRKRHNKSKLGCPQCKQRKIKCDECLPACASCTSKNLECGYLSFTEEQISVIKEAHLRAADKFQYYYYDTSSKSSTTPPDIAPRSSNSDTSKHATYNNVTQAFINIHKMDFKTSPGHSQYTYTNAKSYTGSSATDDSHTFALIPHRVNVPQLNFTRYPFYFNETLASFAARIYTRKLGVERFTHGEKCLPAFYGLIIISYGIFLSKHPEFESLFFNNRLKCINILLKSLENLTDKNATGLLVTSVCLDVSSVFIQDKTAYKHHFKFSTGPSSIIKQVFEDRLKFPNSWPAMKRFADIMLYTMRTVWVPPYNNSVLFEFIDVVKSFGEKFIKNRDVISEDDVMNKQYDDLIEFLDLCADLFQGKQQSDLILRFPIDKLYGIYQRWFKIMPSECHTLEGNTSMTSIQYVFYVLWFSLLKILESFVVNARYVFSFFLDGLFLTSVFERSKIDLALLKDGNDELRWIFNYSCRIIAFFDRRLICIMRKKILNNPEPIYLKLRHRLKVKQLLINETCLTSFKNGVLKEIHYPLESAALNDAMKTPQDLLSQHLNDISFHDEKPIKKETKEALDNNYIPDDVDLLNNVNTVTSLLNNDYDPRFTEEIFNKPPVCQNADMEFFDKYIEDRKLIAEMIDNGETI